MPKTQVEVPPIPTNGSIGRVFIAAPISDYAGISTTSWSAGETGTIVNAGLSYGSWNCLYHHFTVANASIDGYDVIMQPLRYEADCPSTDGGTYDHLYAGTLNRGYPTSVQTAGNGQELFGVLAIDPKLLRSPSHGEFTGGKAYVYTQFGLEQTRSRQDNIFAWMETTLNAISTAKPLTSAASVSSSIHALQHRINGVAVGDLVLRPAAPTSDTRMRIDISPDDVYSCDVWYRLRYQPSLNQGTETKKGCWYLPTTKVSNGSKRRRSAGVPNGPGGIRFGNVDWTPAFNRLEQSYRVTVSGHTGWTLQDGSDGPHVMVKNSRGFGGPNSFGGAAFYPENQSHPYVRGIWLVASCECPFAIVFTGPSCSKPNSRLLYMPDSIGNYRTSVYVTDEANTFAVCPSGPFDQAGTTQFNLIAWSLKGTANSVPFTESDLQNGVLSAAFTQLDTYAPAHRGLIAMPFPDYPGSLEFTRVNV